MQVKKTEPKSKNKTGFLKDNIDKSKKPKIEEIKSFISKIEENISKNIDVLKKIKNKLKEKENFFNDHGYILTEEACERMGMLIHYILSGIPVLIEGPTGKSKTRTAIIAFEYIKKIEKIDSKFLRFNLSEETKIDDLLVKITGDKDSLSGLKFVNGQFFEAYTKGYKILLDEINLAPREVLECIQQSLDSKFLSVELPGKRLKKYTMHPNFGIIATQNPNKGAFANKRQELGVGFLSRFQRICFPNFTRDELLNIAKGLAKKNNYKEDKDKEKILEDLVDFHMEWQKRNNLVEEVQCFTIREIEGVIKAISNEENIYDAIMTIYGARYQKEMKNNLKNKLEEYNSFKNLKSSPLILDKDFPQCFENDNLIQTIRSVLFSLKNERHVIIAGEEESGITQVARWCAECFNKKNNKKNDKNYLCLCTNNLQCSDLIGQTRPCEQKKKSNKILSFKQGFLVKAIKKGKTVIFDNINEANAKVYERLNGLLDKKNNKEEQIFDLPENPKNSKIKIHENFRIICTCNIKNIKDMSPSFVNRFDVIVLEDQLENLNDNK